MVLSVTPRLGLAPLRIAIRWHVKLEPSDRELLLWAADDEAEMVTHRTERTVSGTRTAETVNAHWELSQGRYTVAGCVMPRRVCVSQSVEVS